LDFYNKTVVQMSSLHEQFIAQNSKYKYDKCLKSCKEKNVDFEQFLVAILFPKVDNSKNIYNLVDGIMKQNKDVEIAKWKIRNLADFVRAKIENGGYTAHWMRTILNSIIRVGDCDHIEIARDEVYCLCSELMKTKKYDAHERFIFVLRKYGYRKCSNSNFCTHRDIYEMYFESYKEFPVYKYFDMIENFRRTGYYPADEMVKGRIVMFENLLQRVEAYENRLLCNALGCLHYELQKRKCDGLVEHVFADEYVVARICGFFLKQM
jgi:hypothetical protein